MKKRLMRHVMLQSGSGHRSIAVPLGTGRRATGRRKDAPVTGSMR
ncbi:hypothetical protein [Paenibacillus sp. JZ16]|nr:hypothetical protein [Paenibacillus sp. JZ16]